MTLDLQHLLCHPLVLDFLSVYDLYLQPQKKEAEETKKSKRKNPKKESLDLATITKAGKKAQVLVCGMKESSEMAVREIETWDLPKEYWHAGMAIPERNSDLGSSVDPEVADTDVAEKKMLKIPLPDDIDSDCCLLFLPHQVVHDAMCDDSEETARWMKECTSVNISSKEGKTLKYKRCIVGISELSKLAQHLQNYVMSGHENQQTRAGSEKPHNLPMEPNKSVFSDKRQKWSHQLSHHDFIALKDLMGSEFTKIVVHNEKDGMVEIKSDVPPPQSMITKVDNLRKEEMQLPAEQVKLLGEPFNTRDDGVDAFVLPVPEDGKVLLYSFEYNTLSKAKHLVNVKLGKVKVTARSKRKFDGVNTDSTNQSPPTSLGHISSNRDVDRVTVAMDFFTNSNIKVSVYKTDITKLPVNAIVNAANENLMHGGGVACAIATAAGWQLEDEGKEYIKKNGPLKVTEVISTTAGNLSCKAVLHAVGPKWESYADKHLCKEHLVLTIYNCLKKANDLGFATLAVPSISSAIFAVPQEICAECYVAGVQKFEATYGGKTSLSHVHFVDVNDVMVKIVQDAFSQKWDTPLSLANESSGNQQEPTTGSQVRGRSGSFTKAMSDSSGTADTANYGTRGSKSSNDTASRVHSGEIRPHLDTVEQGATNHTGKKSVEDTSGQLGDTAYNKDVSSSGVSEGCGAFPLLNTVPNGDGSLQYQFNFGGLVLIFHCQNAMNMPTNAIIVWQDKKMATNFNSKTWNTSGTASGNKPQFLFCFISPNDAHDRHKVNCVLKSILLKAEKNNAGSVAIPAFPFERAGLSKMHTKEFAIGVYMAVQSIVQEGHHSLQRIHVVSPDRKCVFDMTQAVYYFATLEMSKQEAQAQAQSVQGSKEAPSSSRRPNLSQESPCPICLDIMVDRVCLPICKHWFCRGCIDQSLKAKPVCPLCQTVYGVITGDQPQDGKMKMYREKFSLPGYPSDNTLIVEYSFPDGQQHNEHPQPGKRYDGIERVAYLPNNRDGRKVLMLLKIAFDRRLIFTIGQSHTTGSVGIVWNDIHHKTRVEDASYGYPDHKYLTRVQAELASKGIIDDDLTDTQKDFIQHPERYFPGFLGNTLTNGDFSYKFK